MSDASTDRDDDRPAEVTDPLLWRLASAVADTHQPDENGACDNGSCLGVAWPCAAWTSAQEGLRAAQAAPTVDQTQPDAPAGPTAELPPPPPWQPPAAPSSLAITAA
ncbi:hypothetical protein ONA91_19860 [Micromonospora sp. DR5-3]|uniref:hypothetical protein n=1 Tax=unclassified Micromonospora TaxID=2617518 RepID=UPI0011D9DEF1|nr:MULTISPECIES: hypothetical protein [unclassified Micromonospora]MCW3816705.1 hypothetical protein [Micromonospora sp. DR5-3]TYC22566.1 hypothetical protein FXF52_20160 [Micromonospora sp. MP36]